MFVFDVFSQKSIIFVTALIDFYAWFWDEKRIGNYKI